MTGVVETFDRVRRFGFIRGEDGRSYFVHRTSLVDGAFFLDPGDRVVFEALLAPRGPRAERVRRTPTA